MDSLSSIRQILLTAMPACALFLSSCGGGDSDSTTTPTPTPTPIVDTYPSPTDYAQDFSFASDLGYAFTRFRVDEVDYIIASNLTNDSKSANLSYKNSPEQIELSIEGRSLFFVGAERFVSTPSRQYNRSEEYLLIGFHDQIRTRYVTDVIGRWPIGKQIWNGQEVPAYRFAMAFFGKPSKSGGSIPNFLGYDGYPVVFSASNGATIMLQPGPASWSITPSKTDAPVSGSVPLAISEENTVKPVAMLQVSGNFDSTTNEIRGRLFDAENDFQGTFRGKLYGPDRAEMAAVFEFSQKSSGLYYLGHFTGKR
ncbi:hypothetical protein [Sphingomonas fennica]|uniref:hypothetical protein n=1 Tax=Edaphosphingomonas fennica TaxID=114404 RepID=UPI0011B24E52|nr:hypothetical protein [Sphingomonas fennica]